MSTPQNPNQYLESRDLDIENAFKIVGIVLLVLIVMVVFHMLVNMFIDLAILRDADSMMRALSQVRRFCCPCWHPRTQNLDLPAGSVDAELGRRPTEQVAPGQITIERLLGNMTNEQRQLMISKAIPTQIASEMDLKKWKNQDDQHSLRPISSDRHFPDATVEEKEGSESADGSHSATLLCPICIHEIEPGDRIVDLENTCSHRFHSQCLFQWLSTQTRDCPYCRRTILTQEMMNNAHQYRREVFLQTSQETPCISPGSRSESSPTETRRDIIGENTDTNEIYFVDAENQS